MKGKIAVNLENIAVDKKDRASLGELLQQAITITCPGINKDTDRAQRREAIWITRWAVRAICDLIIREGKIKVPLQVQFAGDLLPNWRVKYDGNYGLN